MGGRKVLERGKEGGRGEGQRDFCVVDFLFVCFELN